MLRKKQASALADGAVHPQCVVKGGTITLENAASKVQVGLPIEADLQSLPLAVPLQDSSFAQDRTKNINKIRCGSIVLPVFLSGLLLQH